MDKARLKHLIKEVYHHVTEEKCSCGCNTCENVGNTGVILNESVAPKEILSENLRYHVVNQLPLIENTFRYGSESFLNLWAEARSLYLREIIHVNDDDKEILEETDLGNYGMYEGKKVPLDLPMLEEETEETFTIGDTIEINPSAFPNFEFPYGTEGEIFDIDKADYASDDLVYTIRIKYIDSLGDISNELHIENSSQYLNEIIAPHVAAHIASSAASVAARGAHSSGGGGESNPWVLLTLGVLFSLPFAGLAVAQSGLGEKVMNWVKNYKLNRVIDRLRKDPEILEFIKSKKPGIQNFLKSKLTDKEQKYIKQISWNKITKGEIQEINNFLEEAEGKKKNPPIGKPKRGGSKKFYVYVRDKGKVKKVSFGDTSGLSAKINNPEARRAFAKRHDCANKKDRTKASYWSCRLPRFAKLLGLKSSFSGFW